MDKKLQWGKLLHLHLPSIPQNHTSNGCADKLHFKLNKLSNKPDKKDLQKISTKPNKMRNLPKPWKKQA